MPNSTRGSHLCALVRCTPAPEQRAVITVAVATDLLMVSMLLAIGYIVLTPSRDGLLVHLPHSRRVLLPALRMIPRNMRIRSRLPDGSVLICSRVAAGPTVRLVYTVLRIAGFTPVAYVPL